MHVDGENPWPEDFSICAPAKLISSSCLQKSDAFIETMAGRLRCSLKEIRILRIGRAKWISASSTVSDKVSIWRGLERGCFHEVNFAMPNMFLLETFKNQILVINSTIPHDEQRNIFLMLNSNLFTGLPFDNYVQKPLHTLQSLHSWYSIHGIKIKYSLCSSQ